ncbi:MAG TPA: FecR family protein [bacterium]|mgnify:CR=1 FL=1|nr:FecR family protein [bacterium]
MNDPIPERHEHDLSSRFDQGNTLPGDEVERSAFDFYGRVREGLRGHSIPPIDARRLADAMRRAVAEDTKPAPAFRWPFARRTRLAWAVALMAIGLSAAYLAWPPQKTPGIDPIREIRLVNQSTIREEKVIADLHARLHQGQRVKIPRSSQAILTLADASVVTCAPGTELAVRFDRDRWITLDRGEISVKAAHLDDSTFTVQTPLVDVVAVGTEFEVEILR